MIIYNSFSKLGRDLSDGEIFPLMGIMTIEYHRRCGAGNVTECKNEFIEELKAMKERMDELFERNFTADENQYGTEREEDWLPAADIVDTGKALVYVLDLPGVMDEDLQVECKDNRLWISGRKGGGFRTEPRSISRDPRLVFTNFPVPLSGCERVGSRLSSRRASFALPCRKVQRTAGHKHRA